MTDHAAVRAHYEGLAREAAVPELIRSAAAVLACVDHYAMRSRALECRLPLYETAAALKDAIAACQPPVPAADPADLVIESYGDGYAFFRR